MMEDTLKKIMAEVLGISATDIGAGTSMQSVPAWDSIKQMALVASLEENFSISPLSAAEIVQMTSFDKIAEILSPKLS